jgi:hypothetical protein
VKIKRVIKRSLAIILLVVISVLSLRYYDSSIPVASGSMELDFPAVIKSEEYIDRTQTLVAGIVISSTHYSRHNVLATEQYGSALYRTKNDAE